METERIYTTAPHGEYTIISTRNFTWAWCFNGDWHSLTVQTESAPCWFHRLMQRWVLGIHWRKIKE